MANKCKKLSISNLKEDTRYNLGDGITIAKKGNDVFVGYPSYNNPNVSLVNVKRSDASKKTFGSATVHIKDVGNLNVQIYRNEVETTKIDDQGNKISNKDVAYNFRQNNNPIKKSEQLALFTLLQSEKSAIQEMLEKDVNVADLETFAQTELVGKDNGKYQFGDIDVEVIDYKESSSAYKSIIAQKNAGRTLSDAQQAVIDTVEGKANEGISRVVCRYKKRVLHTFDFNRELGMISTDSDTTNETETVNLSEEEEL